MHTYNVYSIHTVAAVSHIFTNCTKLVMITVVPDISFNLHFVLPNDGPEGPKYVGESNM
jgi:hypothetical protein